MRHRVWRRMVAMFVTIAMLTVNTQVYGQTIPSQRPTLASLVEVGDQLLLQSRFTAAEDAYTKAIAVDPENPVAYAHRCYLRTFQQRFQEAIADCQQAVERAPNHAEGYIYLTRAYDWSGEFEKAVEAGERAIALAPNNGLAHSFLGEAYVDLGHLQEGEVELRLAVELASQTPEVHRNLAFFYGKVGEAEAKVSELKIALRLAPEFVQYHQEVASTYHALGRYKQALAHYQKLLIFYRDVDNQGTGNREMEGITTQMIGQMYYNLARYEESISTQEQALVIQRELGNRELEALALHDIAEAYRTLSRYEQALTTFEQALAIWREVNLPWGEGLTLTAIGQVYYDLGLYREALTTLEQALAIQSRIGNQQGEGRALRVIGLAHYTLGDYKKALAIYQQALAIQQETGDRRVEGFTLGNIAAAYNHLNRYEEALATYQQALAIQQEVDDRHGEARTLSSIGSIYLSLFHHDEALSMLQQSLAIQQEIGDKQGEGMTLRIVGRVYYSLAYYEEALAAYQKALTIQQAIGDRQGVAITLNNIGTVYLKLRRDEQALATFEQTLAIHQEIGNRSQEAITLNNVAFVYDFIGRREEALTAYEQSLSIAEETGAQLGQGITFSNIGYLYERQQNSSQAILYYQKSITVTESIQGAISVEEWKTSFASGYVDIYTHLINLLWQESQIEESFEYAERARARVFLDQIGNQQVDFRQSAAPELIEQEQALQKQITSLQNALNAEHTKPVAQQRQELLNTLMTDLEQARKEREDLIIQLKLVSPEYASLVSVNTLSLREIQSQVLDAQTTLVEYFVMDEYTVAWVIDQKNIKGIRLEITRSDLTSRIEFLRNLIADQDFDTDAAAELRDTLFAPLVPHIRHRNLVIVPHGVLHYLPFAALWSTEDQRYLVEEYAITYAPSASVLKFILDKRNDNQGRLVTFGNPDGSLSSAEDEVKTVAQLYDANSFVRSHATESQFRKLASGADILHLAAHGKYNSFNPLYTTIQLAPDAAYDGNLEVHEVYSLDLTEANLVVLSACETALGEQSAGDELIGLTRAFLYAGAPSVVTSLWRVNDESTAYLMERFYTHLRDDMETAVALRQAQLDTMVEYPEPYQWAAFTLHGDNR